MKYINADEFERDCMFDKNCEDMQDVIYKLRDYPSADVAEVIRCKDCRFWKFKECTKVRLYHNTELGVEFGVGRVAVTYPTQANDFCSRGERKDNDQQRMA